MDRSISHYIKMFNKNKSVSIGLSLASQAVYAAVCGVFNPNDANYKESLYRSIYIDLKSCYGDVLNYDDVMSCIKNSVLLY